MIFVHIIDKYIHKSPQKVSQVITSFITMIFQYFFILFHCLCLVLPAARGLDVPHEAEDAGEAPPAAAAAGVEEAQDELEAEAPRLHAH